MRLVFIRLGGAAPVGYIIVCEYVIGIDKIMERKIISTKISIKWTRERKKANKIEAICKLVEYTVALSACRKPFLFLLR